MVNAAIGSFIFVVVIVAIIATVWGVILHYIHKAKKSMESVFGTHDISDIAQTLKVEESFTPRSLSSVTSLMLPTIQKSFPEFSWAEYRAKVQNVISASLLSLSYQNMDRMEGIEGDIVDQIALEIAEEQAAGVHDIYRDIEIHKTEITGYTRKDGLCVINTQSSVSYFYTRKQNDAIVMGDDTLMQQTKYSLDLVYVQDADRVATGDTAVGVTCPNCGGPVETLGARVCEYCGCALEPVNIRVWRFAALKKII